jgi:hypothetical protein
MRDRLEGDFFSAVAHDGDVQGSRVIGTNAHILTRPRDHHGSYHPAAACGYSRRRRAAAFAFADEYEVYCARA